MKQSAILLYFLFFSLTGIAQVNIKDSSIFVPLFELSYAFQFPGGDLVKNYGPNSNLGSNFLIKTRSNCVYGIEGNFLFGENVKDSTVLNSIRTSQGQIIDRDGHFANVIFYQRGYSLFAKGGKLVPFKKPNPNSGILLIAGAGFLQHKMRIEVTGNTVPQLSREYRKGYDRLSNGFAVSQFAGYQYLSSRRLINFYAGIEAVAAFTKNRRGYNYDTMDYDNKKRTDFLFGFRFGWILPLYKKAPKDFYYY